MNIENLTDESAVKALSIVAKLWLKYRGVEAFILVDSTRQDILKNNKVIPSWAADRPSANKESGDFARKMLTAIREGNDDEVSVWADQAVKKVTSTKAQALDPLTLAIGGAILIGAILAARVKKIGSLEFYKGVPKELANVLKVASNIQLPVDD